MTFQELLKTFKVQPDISRKIWDENDQLKPEVRNALLRVAKLFYDSIELKDKPPIKDIVLTGSMAGYNYTDSSDIDLHLLFDFESLGDKKELFEKIFLLAKARWNDNHNILVKGHDVEVYAEDEKSPHVTTGLYSVQDDKWLKKAEKETPVFDELDVKTKVRYFVNMYNEMKKDFKAGKIEGLKDRVEALRQKIKQFRQSGLEKGGIFSVENITFKALRRIGMLGKLADLNTDLVDKDLSVENR